MKHLLKLLCRDTLRRTCHLSNANPMKHLLKFLCLLPLLANAGSINLAWDPSTSSSVTNYVLYAYTNPPLPVVTNWAVRVEVGTNLTSSISDLRAGRW